MGACTECRAAKVRCDLDRAFPCSRCERLKRRCVRHESRQGKGRGKKRKLPRNVAASTSSPPRSPSQRPEEEPASEDAAISGALLEKAAAGGIAGAPSISSDHFGLNYLVRSWVSLAFRRRSFSLLSRAGSLASRCGISMDQILCETEAQRGMDFLYPILLTETPKQDVVDGELDPSRVPGGLWRAIDYDPDDPAAQRERWVWARETTKGVSRFYCSPGFERHVSKRSQMEETYTSNKKSVIDLFLIDRSAQVCGIAHQVAQNKSHGADLKPCRQTGVKIRTVGADEPVEVDQVLCMAIVSLDCSFFCVEYIPPRRENRTTAAAAAVAADAGLDLENFELLDLGDLDGDEELKIIYDLLSG